MTYMTGIYKTATSKIKMDTVYNMDCIEGMALMPDKSVDAIIADLPYGVLNRKNRSAKWDRMIPLDLLWEQYNRIAKSDAPIILFSQGAFTARLIMSQPNKWRYNLVWVKDRVSGHLNAGRMPLRQHEDIVVFYDRLPVYHPQMRPCSPKERNHSRLDPVEFTNRCYGNMKAVPVRMADNKYPTSVIFIPKEHKTGAFYHPTQKPEALVEYLIRTYADERDLVLDNTIGSGTTAVAAINTGRHFIGFDVEPEYCDIARMRINQAMDSLNNKDINISNK